MMHGLGECFLAATGFATQQQRHISLEHPHAAAEIVLQRRVEQAQRRLRHALGHGHAGWHRPHRFMRLPTQAGEHLPAVAGLQRPGSTAVGGRAAEQFVMAAGEEAIDRLAQHTTANAPQQVERALVGRADPTITVKGQQAFAEQPDRLGMQVETQQPLMFEVTQEIAALDHLRREVDQGHGVELALPRDIRPRRRHVEHRQQLAMRIENRAGRAGQAGVAPAKVFALVNGQGLALDQARTDTVGALARLAPVGSQPQTGTLETASLGRCGDAVEDHPTGIGEQYRVAGARQLLVQAVHLGIGDLQHLTQAFAAFQQAPVFQHHRCLDHRRVKVIVLQATQPGARNGRVAARLAGLASGNGVHLLGVATELIALH
ncbi:hypothetical protein D3C81_822180 [compost metagenome]